MVGKGFPTHGVLCQEGWGKDSPPTAGEVKMGKIRVRNFEALLRTGQETFNLIEGLLPDVSSFISGMEVDARIEAAIVEAIEALPEDQGLNANQVNALITDAVVGFITQTVIEGLIDAAVGEFISGDTVDSRIATAVVNFISGDTVDNRISTAVAGFITQTVIEGLISDAIVSAIDALPDEEGLNANQVNALISSAVADFISGNTVDSRIATAVVNFISGDTVDNRISTAVAGFITQTVIEGLISDAIVSAIDALPDEEGLNANQVNALISSAVADFISGNTVDSRIQTAVDALTILTQAQVTTIADARALLRYTAIEKTKLAGIETGAEVNRNAQSTYDLIEDLLYMGPIAGKWQPTVTNRTTGNDNERVFSEIAGTFIQWDNLVEFQCQLKVEGTTSLGTEDATFDLSLPVGSAIVDDSLSGTIEVQAQGGAQPNSTVVGVLGYTFENINALRVIMNTNNNTIGTNTGPKVFIKGQYEIDNS